MLVMGFRTVSQQGLVGWHAGGCAGWLGGEGNSREVSSIPGPGGPSYGGAYVLIHTRAMHVVLRLCSSSYYWCTVFPSACGDFIGFLAMKLLKVVSF
jgi:hypothetical protein